MSYQIVSSDGSLIRKVNSDGSIWTGLSSDPEYQSWLSDGNSPAPFVPDVSATVQQAEMTVQALLDQVAVSWQYESMLSAATYATSTVQKFKTEALALIAWRDSVWSAAYDLLNKFEAGQKPLPSSAAELIAAMPQPPARPVV